ncbi:zincin [Myriangium duriaei CBS 260.36]|uniref:Zincin n=1 Tax=Myriangium duriaei CBS 260.36 TaxID=1168546 RepID=A0A9P4J4X6_9PEZI|nr:zincin [Myriangium duriaei CBS 260.36]
MKFTTAFFVLFPLLTITGSATPIAGSQPACKSCKEASKGLFARSPDCDKAESNHSKRAFPTFCVDQKDPKKIQRAKEAFLDAVKLAKRVLENPRLDSTYKRYFSNGGEPQETLGVFRNIVGHKYDPSGSNMFGQLKLHLSDFDGECDRSTYAYLTHAEPGRPETITICPLAWKQPDHKNLGCSKVGDKTSSKMDSLAGTLLHELFHSEFVGNPTLGQRITDHAYGHRDVRHLGQNDPGKARVNSDSYTWYALETYWSNRCKRDFSSGKKDPSPSGSEGSKGKPSVPSDPHVQTMSSGDKHAQPHGGGAANIPTYVPSGEHAQNLVPSGSGGRPPPPGPYTVKNFTPSGSGGRPPPGPYTIKNFTPLGSGGRPPPPGPYTIKDFTPNRSHKVHRRRATKNQSRATRSTTENYGVEST